MLLGLCLGACSSDGVQRPSTAPSTAPVDAAADAVEWVGHRRLPLVLYLPNWPASVAQRPTTSASIYLANLDARIAQLRRNHDNRPTPDLAQALALSLIHRYRIRGVLADAEAAGEVLAGQVAAHPEHASLQLTYASWLALLHHFEKARAVMDQLAEPAIDSASWAILSDEIELALGNYHALGEAFQRPAENPPADIYLLAARAHAAVLHGDLDLASRLYFEAQTHYRDVGPYPLAWLHTQQGIALLRFAEFEQAARFFRAARERLPQYYLATEHLAECLTELGQFDEARALYAEVIEQTGNAEFLAALAGLEQRAGNTALAASLHWRAEEAYSALLARHPDAYAQHAAEFYLDIGQIEQARGLAERNLKLRQDVGSRLLSSEVSLHSNDLPKACEQLRQVAATGLRPPEYVDLLSRVDCAIRPEG
jgi:tetratricopeptide (TPR) repeat protein